MKFSLIAAAGALAAASQATALSVITPWADTVWTAGGHGEITWKVETADAGKKCDIYLLNGDYKNSNIVAQVTDPATPVDCSVGKYDMHPLNDFAAGSYWIRIGQASTGNWAYSSPFKFEGKGSAKPASVVASPSGAAGNATVPAVSAPGAASGTVSGSVRPSASGSSKPSTTASVDAKNATASATPSNSGASSGMSINTAAVALGAIAAAAFAL